MKISEMKKIVRDGYDRLYCLTYHHPDYRDKIVNLEKKSVKDWRESTAYTWDVSVKWHLTITEEAKFFAIKHILEAMKNGPIDVKSIIHLKESYVLAHSVVANYHEELEKAFQGFDFESFDQLSNSDLHTDVAA